MATEPCRVCGRPIAGRDPRRVTCGHPRCQRTYRERKGGTVESERDHIARLMLGATNGGVPVVQAVMSVARLTGETPAVVRSVWWSMQPEVHPGTERD